MSGSGNETGNGGAGNGGGNDAGNPSGNEGGNPSSGGGPGPIQKIAHNPMSARVPEKVSRGVVATGFLAYFGPNEFVVDFLQFIARPPQLVARVIMPPAVAEQFVAVLRDIVGRYSQ